MALGSINSERGWWVLRSEVGVTGLMEGWGAVHDGAVHPHFHQGAAEGTDRHLHSGSLGDGNSAQGPALGDLTSPPLSSLIGYTATISQDPQFGG